MRSTKSAALAILVCALAASCRKAGTGDNGNGGGNNGNAFSITSTSPEYVFWGEEITLTGTGLSSNKSDYTIQFLTDAPCVDDFQPVIYSATATQLKIQAPIGNVPGSTKKCGPSSASVIVTLNGKKDTVSLKMVGWPRITGVCSHYGGVAGNYVIPGDSAAINMVGATGIWNQENNAHKNAVLLIDDVAENFTWREIGTCSNDLGAGISLDPARFAERKCPTDPDWNGGGRLMRFKVKVPGTDRFDTMSLTVRWLPKQQFTSFSGPQSISLSAGGNPFWTINGKNMYYEKVRFVAMNCPNAAPVEFTFNDSGGFYNEDDIYLPLSLLESPCTYNVALVTACGDTRGIGSLQVYP